VFTLYLSLLSDGVCLLELKGLLTYLLTYFTPFVIHSLFGRRILDHTAVYSRRWPDYALLSVWPRGCEGRQRNANVEILRRQETIIARLSTSLFAVASNADELGACRAVCLLETGSFLFDVYGCVDISPVLTGVRIALMCKVV